MKFEDPKRVIAEAQSNPSKLNVHQHFQRFFLENLSSQPSTEKLDQAASYLGKLTSIRLTGGEVEGILALYPQARILVANVDLEEEEVQKELQFALSHYLLDCAWPTPEEGIDLHEFTALLRRQAVQMGYSTLQGENEFITADDDFERAEPARLYIPPPRQSIFSRLLSKLIR